MNNISGIYQIRNLVNGHIYIGSAINITKRWYHHTSKLKRNEYHRRNKYVWRYE